MSSTNSDTPSKLHEKHTIAETEEHLDKITEPHTDLTLPSIEQVWLSETRYESFTETFYYWVNTEITLTHEDLETLYTYLEDEEFQWEPPREDDYEEEWTEIATQQSRRKWLGIGNWKIRITYFDSQNVAV